MNNITKKLTCIECPKGCALTIDIQKGKVVGVSGNTCPKGDDYARVEVENPMRILTATVLAQGLALKVIPVKTSGPIAKAKIKDALSRIKKLKITMPVKTGDCLVENFLGAGVNLVVTRHCA